MTIVNTYIGWKLQGRNTSFTKQYLQLQIIYFNETDKENVNWSAMAQTNIL
jgi:hypothetical protein